MTYQIRKKEKKDCMEIAHVVTLSWNESYKGIVPDDFLNHLYQTEEERGRNAYDQFDEKNNHQYVLEIDHKIVGFINVGEAQEEEQSNCGEIYAIYILNEYKGYGYGRKLFEMGIKELKQMGFDKMIIGCLVENPTNHFYTHLGGKQIKTRIFPLLQLPENVYYYEKI